MVEQALLAEQVGFDVAAGLVSVDGARRYGVVCNEDGEVDDGATEKLRSDMATERGDTLLFDFGGTTEELKARCEEETGLPAPAAPEFQNWFGSAA